ncbi:MAG TPA: metal-sulfur cluster assembly factor [Steroidobacteraceae bacterium]|nr:metal-sulfur cluster assembly factor [Steroidobacteraceae bacterium]
MQDASSLTREYVLDALREVIDPELGYNIVDLGLIYDLEVERGVIRALITMTTPGCPAQDYILSGVYERTRSLPGAPQVEIDLIWDPPWSPQKMTPVAKAHFGIKD